MRLGRTQLIALRHLTRSIATSLFSLSKRKSASTQFVQVSSGLPRCLCPATSIVWLSLVTWSGPRLAVWPNHRSLVLLRTSETGSSPKALRSVSPGTSLAFRTPAIHRTILACVLSSFSVSSFRRAHVSAEYNIVLLIAAVYIVPLTCLSSSFRVSMCASFFQAIHAFLMRARTAAPILPEASRVCPR